ncbi:MULTISPECIES: type VI secretion system contractile sheath small subunit [Pseudoalteromonas]|uniref:Type VI secretion system contractile sheath small subunit n=1 Tax=Pseudoalteromonas rubra TaxID=43658 RepID=A0A5S3X3W1_9GAMM|nr:MULTISPECIES: type VI secretion system contractile sheath small subunit [Pseudoalteromonas]MCG7537081.1 type VI secretion system contractile sheath small subunit [Pseudoalteromonas sp. OOF1S-7]TMP38372.1 hypothetical protein CWB98_06470 [Pseudoalteromonas rubra]
MAIQDDKNMPKSRVTLRYRTQINGVPEDITLPMRILIAGDFSGFSGHEQSTVAKKQIGQADEQGQRLSLDKRHIFDATEITDIKLHSENGTKLTSIEQYNPVMKLLRVKSAVGGDLQFTHLDAFSPDRILENSRPEIKDKLETKRLLNEVMSNLTNNKRYRQALQDLLTASNSQTVQDELKEIIGIYLPKTEQSEGNS